MSERQRGPERFVYDPRENQEPLEINKTTKEKLQEKIARARVVVARLSMLSKKMGEKFDRSVEYGLIHNASKKIVRTAVLLLATYAASENASPYKADYHNVTPITDKDGVIWWQHEDPGTTHFINMISGLECPTLDEMERLEMIKKVPKSTYKDYREYLKEFALRIKREDLATEIDTVPDKKLDEFINKIPPEKIGSGMYFESYPLHKDDFDESQYNPTPEYDYLLNAQFDRALYESLWEIERLAGNPKVNFVFVNSQHPVDKADYDLNWSDVGRANARGKNFDINVGLYKGSDRDKEIKRIIKSLMAEWAHAYYGKYLPKESERKKKEELHVVREYMERTGTTYDEARIASGQYAEGSGTYEETTHNVIQPKLEQKFETSKNLRSQINKTPK